MSQVSFESISESARLWIFPSSTALSPSQQETLSSSIQETLKEWNAHGSPVQWGFQFTYDQFLVIAVDERTTALSGCSIDSATRAIQAIEHEQRLVLTDNHRVFFRTDKGIAAASRLEFGELCRRGQITADTVVFDTACDLRAFRSGAWERRAGESWHADVFSLEISS